MQTQAPLLTTAAMLEPPRGYRPLAWLGLVVNVLVIPAMLAVILREPTWRAIHIAVGAGAVLPTAVVGIVAAVALLRWRHWGQVLAIVALSMSLAVALPYGIVRLVLVEAGRGTLAVAAPLLWLANTAVLVFWCRPAIRRYLR
ncbi:Hepatitis C virus core protein [Cyanobium sp. FGCU-52]|nr:Hepatitis C virus core protein [Cyanobium sp. FGCU52]